MLGLRPPIFNCQLEKVKLQLGYAFHIVNEDNLYRWIKHGECKDQTCSLWPQKRVHIITWIHKYPLQINLRTRMENISITPRCTLLTVQTNFRTKLSLDEITFTISSISQKCIMKCIVFFLYTVHWSGVSRETVIMPGKLGSRRRFFEPRALEWGTFTLCWLVVRPKCHLTN